MNLKVYLDNYLNQEIDSGILYEGQSYILDVSQFSEAEKSFWIERERLNSHIEYIARNPRIRLKFVNVVGNVNLFGKLFDVRSRKLRDNETGNDQFKSLVEDLNKISSRLSYSYSGVAAVNREVDKTSLNPTEVERFDYFFQFTFHFPQGNNLDSLMNQILNSPNKKTEAYNRVQPISNSKKVSKNFINTLVKNQNFVELPNGHPMMQSPIVNKFRDLVGRSILPVEVLEEKKRWSFDTPENRFVKFFLEEIKSLCLQIENKEIDEILLKKAKELRNRVDFHSNNPFFRDIGRLYFMPDSSSVLINKSGYRELYYHFVQSKFGFVSLVDEFSQISLKSSLKNIATLYEIWVFFMMSKIIFDDKTISATFFTKGIENGDVVRGVSFTSTLAELKYNYSYTRSNQFSYSLSLRPDITLKIGNDLYLFDAKYKFSTVNIKEEDAEILRIIRSEDIHKMHAYLDAITNAIMAVAIYPGDTFIFYNKVSKSVSKNVESSELVGVGAIPLVPNHVSEFLEEFLGKIIGQYQMINE